MKTEKDIADILEKRAEYIRMREELDALIDALTDDVKTEMTERAETELIVGPFRVTWKPIARVTLDSKAVKAYAPEIWQRYAKEQIVRPFSVKA